MAHNADAKAMLDNRGYTGPLVRGQAPYLLIEEAVRNRITESYYWKEQCFGLNTATLCDRAVDLTYIGGTYNDGRRPTPFLCLAFKLLQLHPEREIVDEYLGAGGEEFKYLRALAAFYIRLTSEGSAEVYQRLEPLMGDYRKLRRRGNRGYTLTYVDQFIDDMLVKDRICATSLWKLVPRELLEDEDRLDERVWLVDVPDSEEERSDVDDGEGEDVRDERGSGQNGTTNGMHTGSQDESSDGG